MPRPETEVLVDRAIQMLRKKGSKPTLGLEIGLGSGIISTELLAEFPTLTMWASELSTRAIEVARNNCVAILGEGDANRLRILPVGESQLVCEPFLVELSDPSKDGLRADFLISNPPYLIESDEIEEDVKRQEPAEALFSPRLDDVYFYRKIALHFKELLRDDGFVLLELPSERAGVIRELFQQFEWKIEVVQDLNGRDRILVVTPPIT